MLNQIFLSLEIANLEIEFPNMVDTLKPTITSVTPFAKKSKLALPNGGIGPPFYSLFSFSKIDKNGIYIDAPLNNENRKHHKLRI